MVERHEPRAVMFRPSFRPVSFLSQNGIILASQKRKGVPKKTNYVIPTYDCVHDLGHQVGAFVEITEEQKLYEAFVMLK